MARGSQWWIVSQKQRGDLGGRRETRQPRPHRPSSTAGCGRALSSASTGYRPNKRGHYSSRSATVGDSRPARRAGTMAAAVASPISANVVAASVVQSLGDTP